MAEMSIRMLMTLVDTASPGIRAFTALIDQLGPKVTGLSNRLDTLEGRLNRVGTAGERAATGVDRFATAANTGDTAVGRFGTSVAGTQTQLVSFEGVVRSVEGVLRGFAGVMTQFATTMQTAAGNIANATSNLGAANTQMGQFTTRVHSLTYSLQGLAEAWAATKLFQAGGATVSEASAFQQLEARVKALNRPESENVEFMTKSRELSSGVKFLSLNEAVQARLGALAAMGHNAPDMIDATLPSAVRTAQLLRLRGDKSSMEDIVRNLYGLAEARGQTSDPEAMMRTFNIAQQNVTATGGKLSIRDMETIVRQTKYGGRSLMSDEGFINEMAFAAQLKASGHGGGSGGQGISQAGTAMAQIIKWAEGGVTNKETARLLTAMGILNPNAIRDDSDTTKVNIAAGAIKNSDMALRDPMGWMMSMAPIMLAFVRNNPAIFYQDGKDPANPRHQDEALAKLGVMLTAGQGGVNVAQALIEAILPGPAARINEERKLTQESKGIDESIADVDKTFQMQVDKFHASVKALEVALGEKLLPILTELLDGFSKFVRYLNEVADAHPAAATITVIALAIGAAALALSGLNRLFGIWGALGAIVTSVTTPLVGFGAAWTGAAAAATAAGSTIPAVVATISVLMTRIIPLAAALLAGWDAGLLLAQLEIGGNTVDAWIQTFMARLDHWAADVRTYWLEIFGFITPTEAERRRKEAAQLASLTESATSGKPAPLKEGDAVSGVKPIRPFGIPLRDVVGLQSAIDQEKEIDNMVMGGRKVSEWPKSEQPYLRDAIRRQQRGEQFRVIVPAADVHKETPEEKLRRERNEASEGLETGPYNPHEKPAKKVYNEQAGEFQQASRVARAEMESTLASLHAQFKAVNIGIAEYFDRNEFAIEKGYAEQINALKLELESLKKPAGDRQPIDQAAVDRVSANIDILQAQRQARLDQNASQREVANADLVRQEQDTDRQIEAIGGRRHKAELMRLQELTEKRRQTFLVNNDPTRAAAIVEAGERGAAGIKLDDLLQNIINPRNDQASREERAMTESVKAGAATQMEADQGVYETRKRAAEATLQYSAVLRELADRYGDPRMKKQVEDMISTAQSVSRELSPEILKIKGVMEGSFADFFNGLANHTKNLKSLIFDLFTSIAKGISNLASQDLAQRLGKALFGNLAGTSAGSSSIFSGAGTGLFGMLGKMLGFGGGATTTAGAGGVFSNMFSEFAEPELLNSFASGIDDVPYDMVAQLHKGEKVSTAAANRQDKSTGTSGVMSVIQNFSFSAPTSQETQNQVGAKAAAGLNRARRNT